MKTKLYILSALCAAVFLASCDKTETFDTQWQTSNELQFSNIAANPEYTKLESQTNAGYIMYKEIESGTGATPYFTDQVKVLYTGWYKNDWTKADTYTDDKGDLITNKIIWNSTADRNNIASIWTISNSNIVDGLKTALQHMKVGDKWEIWIPWELGYGSSGNSSIRGYTTLVFEIELVAIS